MKLSKDQKIVLAHRISAVAQRLLRVRDEALAKKDTFAKRHAEWEEARKASVVAAVKKNPMKFLDLEGHYPSVDRDALNDVQRDFAATHPEPQRTKREGKEAQNENVEFASLADGLDRCGRPNINVPIENAEAFKQLSYDLDSAILAGSGEQLVTLIAAFESRVK